MCHLNAGPDVRMSLLPLARCFRGAKCAIRAELCRRQGCIEAVVALPGKCSPRTHRFHSRHGRFCRPGEARGVDSVLWSTLPRSPSRESMFGTG